MAEVMAECTYVPHHPKKIAFVLSAMRHFAAELEKHGINVRYVRLDAAANTGSLTTEVQRTLDDGAYDRIIVTEPGEWRLLDEMNGWQDALGVPVEIREDSRFICSHDRFDTWADGRKDLRMEYFYREMRKETGLLMTESGKPEGGSWNYDKQNRKALPRNVEPPNPPHAELDEITQDVLALVEHRFADHAGTLDRFRFAVTRQDALKELDHFIKHALPSFGDYQDAMSVDSAFLFHSLLSPYLNAGLLDPREVCETAEAAYQRSDAPLNAVEGFIRQIIGWREFVRGIYWLKMPDYAETNYFGADRPLPDFYWSGETDMNCLRHAIENTLDNAYAHHIQRLMVTGNFALLAGLDPVAVNEWYLSVYADAYEWVELPNTHGMALFADGGVFASKPYAASGKYIDRMSDYCKACRYDANQQTGDDACPFNALYWDFLMRHKKELRGNRRMGLVLKSLDRMDGEKRNAIRRRAQALLDELNAL